MGQVNFLYEDIQQALQIAEKDLLKLKNARIAISGASGFIGRWISKVLIEADKHLSLGTDLLLISGKSPAMFDLSNTPKLKWLNHNFIYPNTDLNFGFTHAIHTSTPSNSNTGSLDPNFVNEVALNSLDCLLNDAHLSGNTPNLVHLSSGAVYRNSHRYTKNPILERMETNKYEAEINYASTKLKLEQKMDAATKNRIINGSSPRLFAFYGPHLPLDLHFAIGNFMKNAAEGDFIEITGNSKTIRSYMYPVDLVTLLIKILVSPLNTPVNVGSATPLTMFEVASKISEIFGMKEIKFKDILTQPSSYFPSMEVAKNLYGFKEQVSFEEGLRRWKAWLEIQPRN
jgi:nucleoside-diphosphate-sugar epimerase